MKILNVCLACFYFEGLAYQENLLPYYQKRNGNQVVIASEAQAYSPSGMKTKIENDFVNDRGILVRILKRKKGLLGKKFNIFVNLNKILVEEEPDIIFVHGGQSRSLKVVLKYVKKHQDVRLFIDNHADDNNSPVTSFGSKLNARFGIGYYLRKSSKFVTRFWGTTPWRCDYLERVYGIPKEKIGLLIMGGNDELIDRICKLESPKKKLCSILKIPENSFLFCHGGKLDLYKKTDLLIEAFNKLNNEKAHLIIFGNCDSNIEKAIQNSNNNRIHFLGWKNEEETYSILLAADVVVFPGTHSVLWEQAISCKKPCIFKKWPLMNHLDFNGNASFVSGENLNELYNILCKYLNDSSFFEKINRAANLPDSNNYLYSVIASKSISK